MSGACPGHGRRVGPCTVWLFIAAHVICLHVSIYIYVGIYLRHFKTRQLDNYSTTVHITLHYTTVRFTHTTLYITLYIYIYCDTLRCITGYDITWHHFRSHDMILPYIHMQNHNCHTWSYMTIHKRTEPYVYTYTYAYTCTCVDFHINDIYIYTYTCSHVVKSYFNSILYIYIYYYAAQCVTIYIHM